MAARRKLWLGLWNGGKGTLSPQLHFFRTAFFVFPSRVSIVLPKLGWATATNDIAMAAYLFIWGLFTAVMFVGTLRLNVALQVVFGSLTILFFLLAIGDFTHASPGFKQFTGYEGIFCGFSAIYAGLAQVLNEVYGKVMLPLGPVIKVIVRCHLL